jgi:hypothetical protein
VINPIPHGFLFFGSNALNHKRMSSKKVFNVKAANKERTHGSAKNYIAWQMIWVKVSSWNMKPIYRRTNRFCRIGANHEKQIPENSHAGHDTNRFIQYL